ncbi:TPA: MFS transporter [Streptococcus suis]
MNKKEKKNIWFLVGSKGISRIGNTIFDFANNSFLANVRPNSLALVALYQSLECIIGVLFNLFGGVIADNFKRKKIIIITNFFSGILCVLLSFIYKEEWLIYAVVLANVILAILDSFSSPTYKAFSKEIVYKDNISQLNSYLETSSTIIKVSVPIIAVSLYNKIGIQGVLLLDGISFLLASLVILLINPINQEIFSNKIVTFKGIFSDLKLGFRYIFNNKEIFIIIMLSAFVNFFLAPYNLLLPFSDQMFHNLGNGLYGKFLTVSAIGGLMGAILSGITNKKLSIYKLLFTLSFSGVALSLAPYLFIAFKNSLILSLSPLLFNLFLSIFNIQFFSIVQRDVDNEYLGRVFGIIFSVALLFMPLGTGVFSIFLDSNNLFNFSYIGISVTVLSFFFLYLFDRFIMKN